MKNKKLLKLIIISIVFVVLFSPYFFINIDLIGDKNITVNYGESYSEPGYKAKIFDKNISDKIKIDDNISTEIGDYEVTYSYKFLFYTIKNTRKVEVKDIEKPKIELTGGDILETIVNEEYTDLGFTVLDNKDGDLTDKVNVAGFVDNKTLGNYEIKYEVTDNSGNKATKIRTVKVVRKNPKQMSIKEYSLDGWYEESKVKETENKGNEYFNEIVMVGDSNTMNMYLNGYLKGVNAWAIPCLHAANMHYWDINLYGLGIQMKLLDAVSKYQPSKMILNLGIFSTTWIKEDQFIEKSNEIIEKIKEASPNTELMLISIYPISQYGTNENKFDQNVINKYNFMILEMANKHNIKYLDVQEALKDESGYGNPYYFVGDGFHLTLAGHSAVKEYIKTHALEEEL